MLFSVVFFSPAIEKELRQQGCGETTPLVEMLSSTSAENDRIVTQNILEKNYGMAQQFYF